MDDTDALPDADEAEHMHRAQEGRKGGLLEEGLPMQIVHLQA